jgi:hypothetical protein
MVQDGPRLNTWDGAQALSSSSLLYPDRRLVQSSLTQCIPGSLSPGTTSQKRESDHSPPNNVEMKHA